MNFLVYGLLTEAFCGLQTTLWPQFIGESAIPPFWIVLIFHISMTRPPTLAIFLNYFIAYLALSFTTLPAGLLFSTVCLLSGLLYFLKSRIYSPNLVYFVLGSGITTLAYYLIYLLLALILEKNYPSFWYGVRWLQIPLAALIAPLIYFIGTRLDRWVGTDSLFDMGEVPLD